MATTGTPFIARPHASFVCPARIVGRVARRTSDVGVLRAPASGGGSSSARAVAAAARRWSESFAYFSTSKDGGTVGLSPWSGVTISVYAPYLDNAWRLSSSIRDKGLLQVSRSVSGAPCDGFAGNLHPPQPPQPQPRRRKDGLVMPALPGVVAYYGGRVLSNVVVVAVLWT